MATDNELKAILTRIVHPENEISITESGMVESIHTTQDSTIITLSPKKANDPFIQKIKRAVIAAIEKEFPELAGKVSIIIKEPAPKNTKAPKKETLPANREHIHKVIAVSSCKGGVGKSTVTANLAATLAMCGYSVGVMDADVYGPSLHMMFGVEKYVPLSNGKEGGEERILPAVNHGVKIMSLGFFIKPDDALVWRGPMATNALKQLLHQTEWGELDFLLIDLPPGTGDIHLSIISEIKIDGAIIVSTPQSIALADVVRGIEMFGNPNVNIKILGLVENMAWFTPKELPDNKYYIFGKDGCKKLAAERNLPLLAQIPLMQSVNQHMEEGKIEVLTNNVMFRYFHEITEQIAKQLAE